MTPRCTQCGWRMRDADEAHSTLECYALSTAKEALPTKRGVDVRELRRALRDVVAMGGGTIQRAMSRAWEEQFRSERNAARAELAGVAAQRDAYLSRSVELATRVTELEAALKRTSCTLTATPEPVEVDGFRVGDLVRYLSNPSGQPRDHWRAIERFNHQRAVYRQSGECGIGTEFLTRKPVEVGDTVRFAGIGIADTCVVRSIQSNEVGVKWCYFDDDACARLADCIAVTP